MAKLKLKRGGKTARTMKYTFREGVRVKGVKADIVGRELERIESECGELTPAAVVEESRPSTAPLHSQFEWNDKAAAHEHRLSQARSLIRAVYVVLEPNATPTPQYVHVQTEDGGVYKPVSVVLHDPDMLASAIGELQQKLASAARSVNELRAIAKAAGNNKKAKLADTIGKHLDAAQDAAKKAA